MDITSEHLHRAADIVGKTEDPAELGFAENALEQFVEESTWDDVDSKGPSRDLDPLSLAMGVSIGVLAGRQQVEHCDHCTKLPSCWCPECLAYDESSPL